MAAEMNSICSAHGAPHTSQVVPEDCALAVATELLSMQYLSQVTIARLVQFSISECEV
jgi:hypothetical protein